MHIFFYISILIQQTMYAYIELYHLRGRFQHIILFDARNFLCKTGIVLLI